MFMKLLLKDAKPWNQEFVASLAAHSKTLFSPTKILSSSPKPPDCLLAYIETLHCLMLIKLQAVSSRWLCILLARRNGQMRNSLLICACCV